MEGKYILVVEDDAFLTDAYETKFKKAGYQVAIAKNGGEALNKLHEYVPDLIILDLIMPEMDGLTVLENIKKDERLKGIPVIVASNLGQKEDIDKARQLGAIDYVVKADLSMKELLEKVDNVLKKPSGQ